MKSTHLGTCKRFEKNENERFGICIRWFSNCFSLESQTKKGQKNQKSQKQVGIDFYNVFRTQRTEIAI